MKEFKNNPWWVKLGRRIIIPASAKVLKVGAGFKSKWNVPTVQLTIGIGKDHTAELIMSQEDWEALKAGEEIKF
jgi:hypothetical protein